MVLQIQPQFITFGSMIQGRLLRIPSYQRAYSWQARQRTDLFGDIERTWEAGSGDHFMATVVGLRRETIEILTHEYQTIDIVDGQQRLTTLVLLLKSIAKAMDRSDEVGNTLGREIDEVLVKRDNASLLLLQTNHDSSNYFADYLRSGVTPPLSRATTLADREILLAIRECEGFVSRWQRKAHLTDLITLIRNRLTFIFHEIANEAAVYTVFEVLNSRGLIVSHFDRLKSLLMAVVFDSESGNREELVDEVHRLWGEIYHNIGLRRGSDTAALQLAGTLKSPNRPSKPLGEPAARDVLHRQAQGDPRKVIETTQWLLSVTQVVEALASDRRRTAVTGVFQARLLAVAILLRSDLNEAEKQKLMQAWESATYQLYGMLKHDARWDVGDYVRLAWRLTNEQLTLQDALAGIQSLIPASINNTVEQIRRDWYNHRPEAVRYFFHRYEEHLSRQAGQLFNNEQWNRIWEQNVAESIEHILPQSSGDHEYMHRIGNLLLLPPRLNSQLGGKEPWEKAEAYQKTGLLIAQKVVPHLANWNREAIESREEELLQWASQEWANPLQVA